MNSLKKMISYYNTYCTTLAKIREVKKLHYNKLISKSENKIQTSWNIIKKAKNQGIDNTTDIIKSVNNTYNI
jgi:flagellar biosynthesis chaperone FliJ